MKLETLKLLKGKHTIESVAEELGIEKSSAANLLSKLKKEGYVKTEGGGRQKRIYTISTRKDISGKSMFDIINRYSKIKIVPAFKHVVKGKYGVEHALVDAVLTKDFRTIQASLYLFNHVKNWKLLHQLARKKDVEQELGSLYDTARCCIKTRKMPENIRRSMKKVNKKKIMVRGLRTDCKKLKKINKEWNVVLPFSEKDLEELR
ncbi:MAG: winged helix-turn-helix domain-containing protein [Candidatus Nanoarchaeia archaeon]